MNTSEHIINQNYAPTLADILLSNDLNTNLTAHKHDAIHNPSSLHHNNPCHKSSIEEELEPPITTMRAIILEKLGEPLLLKQVPIPTLLPGQLLIKIEAAPINASDLNFLTLNTVQNPDSSTIPLHMGFEGSGTVVSSGGGLQARALVGKRVAFAATGQPGTWAEYAMSDINSCFPLDKRISFDRGASVIVSPFTALALVNLIKREQHQAIVQTAAGSSLGRMMTKLLKKEGVKTINIIKDEEHRKPLTELGGDIVLNSDMNEFESELKRQIEEMKATCLLECVCGDITRKVLKIMPSKSNCYVYGIFGEGKLTEAELSELEANSKFVKPFCTLDWLKEQGFFKKLGMIKKVESMMRHDLMIDTIKTFRFEDVNDAINYCVKNMGIGKVLLKPSILEEVVEEGPILSNDPDFP